MLRQFLLEILTEKIRKNIIQWHGNEGEFELLQPDRIAELWGRKTNESSMNCETLESELSHYDSGDMISKVSGKRFVYKFICNLMQLTGYSALELSDIVENAP